MASWCSAVAEADPRSVILFQRAAAKDVDGFHPSTGKLMLGDDSCFRPCTPAGVVELLVRSV